MTIPTIDADFSSREFKHDPHHVYASLRATSPIARVKLRGLAGGGRTAVVVARYEDVSAILKDARLVKNPANAGLPPITAPSFLKPLFRNMLGLDDPDHARLKKLVQFAFTPRRVETLKQHAEATSRALLDRLHPDTPFDLVRAYAMPFPVTVISRLLGVPPADQDRFARWSGALIRVGASATAALTSLPAVAAFLRYIDRLIAMKRRSPGDDLISDLVAARDAGDRLSTEELMAMISILLSAGHETTANLIANGMLALFDDRDALDTLRANPDLIGSAVEELLRFASPVAMSTDRYAREDMQIGGALVERGTPVFGLIASANRDETRFDTASRLNLARTPNRHLTFGEGGHYCVGAALARMEGAIAFADLLAYFPRLRLAEPRDRLKWRSGLVLSGLEQCLVRA